MLILRGQQMVFPVQQLLSKGGRNWKICRICSWGGEKVSAQQPQQHFPNMYWKMHFLQKWQENNCGKLMKIDCWLNSRNEKLPPIAKISTEAHRIQTISSKCRELIKNLSQISNEKRSRKQLSQWKTDQQH